MFNYIRVNYCYSLLFKVLFDYRQWCKFELAYLRKKMGCATFDTTSGLKKNSRNITFSNWSLKSR